MSTVCVVFIIFVLCSVENKVVTADSIIVLVLVVIMH